MDKPDALRLVDVPLALRDDLWHTQAEHVLLKLQANNNQLSAQRDALLEALLRIESAVDWYLGRSSFTQTTQLKGLKHSANVRKELFAAHDEVRAAIKAVEEGK